MAVDLSRTNIERNWKAPRKIPLQAVALTPPLSHCTVRGHSEHLFGDMVDTYN